MLQPGALLAGRYQIERLLGKGGMGRVYLARDVTLGLKPVALKEMSVPVVDEAERAGAALTFQKEAHILAALDHTNLVVVSHYFEELGRHYLVMGYIEGRTLQEVAEDLPALVTPQRVMEWFEQIADVLEYLHLRTPPVLCRDLKPSNIMLDRAGRIRLIDFGIARVLDGHATATFIKGAGTPGYAPVEQYGSGQTDARSDIYALGATLYFLLTGRVPPPSVDLMSGDAVLLPASTLNPDVPQSVAAVISRMMASRKQDRAQSIEEVRRDMRAALGRAVTSILTTYPSLAPTEILRPLPRPRAAPEAGEGTTTGRKGRRSSRRLRARRLHEYAGIPLSVLKSVSAQRSFQTLQGHAGPVTCVAAGGADVLVTAGLDGSIRLWNFISGGPASVLHQSEDAIVSLAVSFNGHLLAWSTAAGAITLRAIGSSTRQLRLSAHRGVVRALDFSPDGRMLASGGDDFAVILWAGGEEVARLEGHNAPVGHVRFSPSGGRLLTVGADGRVLVFVVPWNGRPLVVDGQDRRVAGAAFVSEQEVVTCSQDRFLTAWTLPACQETQRVPHWTAFCSVDTLRGRLVATSSADSVVCLWQPAPWKIERFLEGHEARVNQVRFVPSRHDPYFLVSASDDGTARVWKLED